MRNIPVLTAVAIWAIGEVKAQSVGSDGCLRLLGSVACPGFQYAYINPANLSNAWPWLAGVTTVAQFDVAALNYFVNPYQFQQTKFVDQLGCNNATGYVIQYERSRLCSQWVNSEWGRSCTANYNGTSAATSQKMLCQSTCLQYAASARNLVNSSTYCPGPDNTNGLRTTTLLKDYVDCTDWFTLTTNNTQTCVRGDQNEGNCGFGSSTSQLCGYCQGNTPDECCYQSNTDVSVCGYTLAARPSSSSSSAAPSSTSSSTPSDQANSGSSSSLSGGRLAGVIVGSILGGLLLLALLILLLLCLRRRRNRQSAANRNSTTSSFAPGLFSANTAQPNASEKGLLGKSRAAGVSSPTMGGDTLYSGHNQSMDSAGMLGGGGGTSPGLMSGLGIGAAGAAAGAGLGAAAGGGGGPGMRTSGIVLPRVRDENASGADKYIETGSEVSVLWPYQATLPDELELKPGMKLRVLRLYDDSWGTGVITEGEEVGRQGAFPVVCVSEGSTLGSPGASRSSTASH